MRKEQDKEVLHDFVSLQAKIKLKPLNGQQKLLLDLHTTRYMYCK